MTVEELIKYTGANPSEIIYLKNLGNYDSSRLIIARRFDSSSDKVIKTLISWIDVNNFLEILIDDVALETDAYKLGISCHVKMLVEFTKKEISGLNSELTFVNLIKEIMSPIWMIYLETKMDKSIHYWQISVGEPEHPLFKSGKMVIDNYNLQLLDDKNFSIEFNFKTKETLLSKELFKIE